MINQLGQVMLYVNDQDQSVKFWTEVLGFTVVNDEDNGEGFRWIEIVPSKGAETSIVLQNKELIAKMQPELNLGTPSLMFFTENVEELRNHLISKNITVGDLVEMSGVKIFNFADYEENYFAVQERK